MIKLACVTLATGLGLAGLSINEAASAGVVVGVGLPTPLGVSTGVPAVARAAAVYPYGFVGSAYYPSWRYPYPYYFGYRYGWHPRFGWGPRYSWGAGYRWHGGYARAAMGRGWHR